MTVTTDAGDERLSGSPALLHGPWTPPRMALSLRMLVVLIGQGWESVKKSEAGTVVIFCDLSDNDNN